MNRIFHPAGRLALAALLALGLAQTAGAETLRFGILPAVDAVPYLVAADEGLFAAQGLDVKLVSFKSPLERDAAIQSGAVDGTIGDVFSAALAAQGGFGISIVAATEGRYLLLAAPGSKLTSARDLAGVPVGGSTHSVVHYMIDRFLTRAGVPADQVKVLPVPALPVRLQMLVSGQVAAVCLPEPLATAAVAQGAKILASSEEVDADPGVLFFSKAYGTAHPDAVKAFLKAGAQAGAAINADNDRYRAFLVQKAGFPESVGKTFRFVTYRPPRLASDASITSILVWMKDQGLLKAVPSVDTLVDRRPTSGR